jgi:hypothetical protein
VEARKAISFLRLKASLENPVIIVGIESEAKAATRCDRTFFRVCNACWVLVDLVLVRTDLEARTERGYGLRGEGMMMGKRAKLDPTGLPFERVLSARPEIVNGAAWNMPEC